MANPLVTVICLCYNHERFVRAAIESVIHQTYRDVQIIVWDDASTDNSPAVINELQREYPQLQVTLSKKNERNTRAFNNAYADARGEFVIDFSTDDIMHPERIKKQVEAFRLADEQTGVVFTDATYINEYGEVIRHHYEHLFRHKLITEVATGDVFRNVLTTYYIASPTMMMRRSVMEVLGGYDEELSYEDFDLWVRSARLFKYAFLNERLCFIRLLHDSLSAGQYARRSPHLLSTYLVCQKAIDLCRDDKDRKAIARRIRYELRQATLSDNADIAQKFWLLMRDQKYSGFQDLLWIGMSKLKLPLTDFRKLYHRLRFGG
ncbi:MAG: glycosyltransferase [Chryseolinea sp.]